MALTASGLQTRIENELAAQGVQIDNPHCWARQFAQAIAQAVVDEIQANAQVTIPSGSSAGTYPVT